MTRRMAVEHYWKLKQIGFTPEVMQFSPDRSGWGIAIDGECLKTVAACELTERAEPEVWRGFKQAVLRSE